MAESGSESEVGEDSPFPNPIKNTNTINSCAQSSSSDEKLSKPKDFHHRVRSPPPISLPFITFQENDCDEVEKLARAKRIEVIMKLSAEAKAKEAERRRVANIKPLSWDKPTFDYPSKSSNAGTTTAAAAAASDVPTASTLALGKRKAGQEGLSRHFPYFVTSRIATEEEIESLVDFADTYFPSGKRRSTDKVGDDKKRKL